MSKSPEIGLKINTFLWAKLEFFHLLLYFHNFQHTLCSSHAVKLISSNKKNRNYIFLYVRGKVLKKTQHPKSWGFRKTIKQAETLLTTSAMVLKWILTGISAIFSSTFHRFTDNKSIKAFCFSFIFCGKKNIMKKNAEEKLVVFAREREDSDNISLLRKRIRIDRVDKNMK